MKYKIVLLCIVFLSMVKLSHAQVLAKIESFKPAPYPVSDDDEKETYDYRIASGKPVPSTFTDLFIGDIWQRIYKDLHLFIPIAKVNEPAVDSAFSTYLTKDWSKIAGYLPWTHWNFIRSLIPEQRKTLSKEVVAYILKNGVQD